MKTKKILGISCITGVVVIFAACAIFVVFMVKYLFSFDESYETKVWLLKNSRALPPGIEATNIYFKISRINGAGFAMYEMKGFTSNTWNYISKKYERESYTDGFKKYVFPEANISHITNQVIAICENQLYDEGYVNDYIICSNNIAYLLIMSL